MNIFSKFFSSIGGFFSKQLKSLNKVFSKIAPVLETAASVIQKIDAVVTAETKVLGSPAVLGKLKTYLDIAVTDSAKVSAFVSSNAANPVDVILRNTAAFVIDSLHGNLKLSASQLNLAVETALATVKG